MTEGDLHQRKPVFRRDPHPLGENRHLGFRHDVMRAENRVDELLVGGIDRLGAAAIVRQLPDAWVHHFGHQNVDPIGGTIDMSVDPGQFLLELLGGEAGRTKNAKAARPAHCSHHVAAMAEGKQGEFGASECTQTVHGHEPLLSRVNLWCCDGGACGTVIPTPAKHGRLRA